ncbi:unnamed protein product [Litomosoides sigmodontis]|uniref:Uncharacterized protein n=1 Tax=Litomosoides sigmodontis TaxID=42156 RepID=A0A3P6SUS9_LITSI|nr:unnamed protein product [Litomosoides sigmodontis]
MKWYVINLMAAYSIGSIGRSVGLEFEKRPELYEGTLFSILYGLTIYLRAATFALTRLIVFFCILEIYSIYAFKTKILKALYKSDDLSWHNRYFIPQFDHNNMRLSGIILVINIDTNVLKVFLQVNAATVRIRATFLALYTIFVLPPFRRAMFDLLGFKRHQRSSVVPLNATNLTVGRNGM